MEKFTLDKKGEKRIIKAIEHYESCEIVFSVISTWFFFLLFCRWKSHVMEFLHTSTPEMPMRKSLFLY